MHIALKVICLNQAPTT